MKETNQDGQTALHLACSQGHLEVVKILIDRKAPIDVVDGNGLLAFELIATPGTTLTAIGSDNPRG